MRPKQELIRIVREPSGAVELDATGRKAGRGAYICPNADCLEAAVKGRRLDRALKRPVEAALLEKLRRELAGGT